MRQYNACFIAASTAIAQVYPSKPVRLIVPIEIENALMEHPAVAEACVMPAPHDEDGNLIRAIIVPRDPNAGGDALVEELRTLLKSTIARNKVPHLLEFMDELPKSAVGRVMRRALVERKT